MKSKTTALLLSVLVGGLGIDRFYLGYTGMGILKLLTGGCWGFFGLSTSLILPPENCFPPMVLNIRKVL